MIADRYISDCVRGPITYILALRDPASSTLLMYNHAYAYVRAAALSTDFPQLYLTYPL